MQVSQGDVLSAGQAAETYVRSDVRPPNLAEVDWAAAPFRFKLYRNCEHIPLAGGTDANDDATGLSGGWLGRMLWDVYGATRLALSDSGATAYLLRPVPSGGGRYPCELYLIAGTGMQVPPGTYHYDALHYSLDILRRGPDLDALRQLLAAPDDAQPICAFVLCSLFWKNAFKYGAFSYRLQGLDSGALIAQTQTVAAEYGLRAKVHVQFLDRPLNRLLGLETLDESAYAVVTLTPAQAEEVDGPSARAGDRDEAGTQRGYPDESSAVAATEFVTRTRRESIAHWPTCEALHIASLAETTDDFQPIGAMPSSTGARQSEPSGGCPVAGDILLPPGSLDLNAGRLRRRSAQGRFVPTPISQVALAGMLRASTSGYANDVDGSCPHVQHTTLYCVVNAVEQVAPGVYWYDAERHALRLVRADDMRADMAAVATSGLYNMHAVGLNLFAVGDYRAGFAVYGDRWHRMQNMEAGIIVQRLYLGASALGLGCRANLGFHVGPTDKLLCLPDGVSALVQVMISHEWESHLPYEQDISL